MENKQFLLNIIITKKQVFLFCFPFSPKKWHKENLNFSKEDSKEDAARRSCCFWKTSVNHLQKQPGEVLKATYQWAHLCSLVQHLPFLPPWGKVYSSTPGTGLSTWLALTKVMYSAQVLQRLLSILEPYSHTKKSRFSCWTQRTHGDTGPGGHETTGWRKSLMEDHGVPPDSKPQVCKGGQRGPPSSSAAVQSLSCQA